jgi:hypothetical protein
MTFYSGSGLVKQTPFLSSGFFLYWWSVLILLLTQVRVRVRPGGLGRPLVVLHVELLTKTTFTS